MFVGIVKFPKIKDGKETQFLKWFEWTNAEFRKFDGFISRQLLKSKSGNYTAVVEFDSEDVHTQIHSSPVHKEAILELNSLLDEPPKREFYQVVSK